MHSVLQLASSGSGDVEIDSGGDIILDADNADVILKDDGTEFGRLSRVASDLVIKSATNNKDILFKGVDWLSGGRRSRHQGHFNIIR